MPDHDADHQHQHQHHDDQQHDDASIVDEYEVWAFVESSPDGILLADERGTILMVNAQIEAIFGYDGADLLGQPVETLIPESHRAAHTADRIRYRSAPTTRAMGGSLKLHGSRKDGTEFPVEVSLSPLPSADGPLRIMATVRDITERVAIDAHIQAVFEALDTTPDAVYMFDADTLEFSYTNRGAVEQLGYDTEELTSMTPLHIEPDMTERTFRSLIEPLLDGAADTHLYTTVHRSKDGSDTPVEISLKCPRPSRPNEHRVFVAVARDISDRLKTEQLVGEQRAQALVMADRSRLARDLHDTVIQQIFATGMGLQSIRPLIENVLAGTQVDDTIAELDQTIRDLRAAIFELSGPTTTTIGTQLRTVIDRSTGRLGFAPTVRFTGDPETIPTTVVDELLPTVTEAMSNIVRHAQATSVDIAITVTDGVVELVIDDDGVGLPPRPRMGNGLNNIGSRSRLLDGEFSVAPGRAGGTTLRWTARLGDRR